jgi:3-phenylpropionate/trans-cinnamate dioxygenase ferredoxin reductase subunit
MTRDETFLSAGAGLAGARAAEALRAEGFDGRVLLSEPARGAA